MRAAGHTLTTHLLEEWAPNNESDESFTKDPPNGTVSVFSTDGSKIRDAVVVLKTAKLEGDKLTFDVDVLEGELTGGDGPAALFIDRFGFGGFHAGGFHAAGFRGGYARVGGVGRVGAVGVGYHPYVARGAWYRGAPYAAVRSAALRLVRRRSVPRRRTHIRTAATIPIRLATGDVKDAGSFDRKV